MISQNKKKVIISKPEGIYRRLTKSIILVLFPIIFLNFTLISVADKVPPGRGIPFQPIKKEDLDLGIQKCIESKDRCTAYQILPSTLNVKRVGNFWLDLFTFKRHTVNTGWEFRGLITIVDNIVSYRDPPGGRPLIHTDQVDIKPLGPVQEVGGVIITEIPKLW